MEDTGRFRKSQELDVAIYVPNSDDPSPPHQMSPAESHDSLSYTSSTEAAEITFADTPAPSLDPRHDSEHLSNYYHARSGWRSGPAYFQAAQDSAYDIVSYDSNVTGSREPQPNVGLASLLTEYWYTDACRKYSTFDSATNRNRQLAMSLCPRSEAVSCAMQSMSAACLMETLPQARAILASLTSRTLSAIRQDLAGFLSARTLVHMGVPVESLFATFALGTAMLWSNSRELAFSLRDKAAKMLDLCDVEQESSASQERKDFEFFRSCLIHWDSYSFTPSLRLECKLASLRCNDLESRKARFGNSLPRTMHGNSNDATILHPWTGLSGPAQEMLALVVCLCQQERTQQKQHWLGSWSPSMVDDITSNDSMARDFRDNLVAQNIDDAPNIQDEYYFGSSTASQTDDDRTPRWHLACIAEAFRLSALLQLYLTFSGLSISRERLTDHHDSPMRPHSASGTRFPSSRRRETSELALRMTELMTQLDANSGTACVQPLLYLCAATGLRYDGSSNEESDSPDFESSTPKPRQDSGVESYEQLFESFAQTSPTSSQISAVFLEKDDSNIVSAYTWKVASARRQIIKSLERLQERLPPRVGEVTLQLVKGIWAAYDSGDGGYGQDVHWLDVVGALGLKTPFG